MSAPLLFPNAVDISVLRHVNTERTSCSSSESSSDIMALRGGLSKGRIAAGSSPVNSGSSCGAVCRRHEHE